jgi:hypothetical protein
MPLAEIDPVRRLADLDRLGQLAVDLADHGMDVEHVAGRRANRRFVLPVHPSVGQADFPDAPLRRLAAGSLGCPAGARGDLFAQPQPVHLPAAVDRHEWLHPVEQHALDREATVDQVDVLDIDIEPLPGQQRRARRLFMSKPETWALPTTVKENTFSDSSLKTIRSSLSSVPPFRRTGSELGR